MRVLVLLALVCSAYGEHWLPKLAMELRHQSAKRLPLFGLVVNKWQFYGGGGSILYLSQQIGKPNWDGTATGGVKMRVQSVYEKQLKPTLTKFRREVLLPKSEQFVQPLGNDIEISVELQVVQKGIPGAPTDKYPVFNATVRSLSDLDSAVYECHSPHFALEPGKVIHKAKRASDGRIVMRTINGRGTERYTKDRRSVGMVDFGLRDGDTVLYRVESLQQYTEEQIRTQYAAKLAEFKSSESDFAFAPRKPPSHWYKDALAKLHWHKRVQTSMPDSLQMSDTGNIDFFVKYGPINACVFIPEKFALQDFHHTFISYKRLRPADRAAAIEMLHTLYPTTFGFEITPRERQTVRALYWETERMRPDAVRPSSSGSKMAQLKRTIVSSPLYSGIMGPQEGQAIASPPQEGGFGIEERGGAVFLGYQFRRSGAHKAEVMYQMHRLMGDSVRAPLGQLRSDKRAVSEMLKQWPLQYSALRGDEVVRDYTGIVRSTLLMQQVVRTARTLRDAREEDKAEKFGLLRSGPSAQMRHRTAPFERMLASKREELAKAEAAALAKAEEAASKQAAARAKAEAASKRAAAPAAAAEERTE